MRIPYLLCFLSFVFLTSIQAQNTLSQWDSLLQTTRDLEQIDKALLQAERQVGKQDSFYARFLYYKGVAFRHANEADSSFFYYKKAIAIQERKNKEHRDYVNTLLGIGDYYKNKENYNEALAYNQKALDINKRIVGTKHIDYLSNLLGMAVIYRILGQYDIAESFYLDAIAGIKETIGTKDKIYLSAINGLGSLYKLTAKYEQAEHLYKETLVLAEELFSKKSSVYATVLNNLSNIYTSRGAKEEAVLLQKESLAIKKSIYGVLHKEYAMSLNNLASTYFSLGKTELALSLYKEAAEIYKTVRGEYSSDYAMALQNEGSLYYWLDDCDKALKIYALVLKIKEKVYGKRHPIYLEALNNLLDIQLYCGPVETAWKTCSEAIELNTKIPLPENKGMNEAWTESILKADILSMDKLLYSLYYVYQLQGKTEGVEKDKIIHNQFLVAELALSLLEQYKNEFNGDEDKLSGLQENAYWIAYTLQLAREAPDKRTKAFQAVEQSKSILLMESIKTSYAYSMGTLPDSLATHEQELQAKKDELQAALYNPDKSSNKDSLLGELNELKREIEVFKKQLESSHPNYYQLKYADISAKTEDIQKLLDEKTLFLEYFMDSDTAFYVFVISKNALEMVFIPIEKENFAKEIAQLRKALTDYDFIKNNSEEAYQLYTSTAYTLYQKVLAPVLAKKDDANRLIIATDGELGHLPFEAFLYEAIDKPLTYSELPYLLNKYTVSYSYSATLWKQNREIRPQGNGKMLAMAASYQQKGDDKEHTRSNRAPHLRNLRNVLEDLPAAREEVLALSELFQGSFLQTEKAVEGTFKLQAQEYGIIHLAMHGLLNKEKPILSSLAFTENGDSTEDNFLEAWEIAHLKLNADLVVLSACETGYGKFQQGEGVMSLARSFMYAGVPSLVVSMWQVNDASTSLIMQSFYKNLAGGMDKAEALRQAKLEYIGSADDFAAHPAFWAPFVQLGDSRPIHVERIHEFFLHGQGWWWIGGGLLAVVAVGGGAMAMRRRRKES